MRSLVNTLVVGLALVGLAACGGDDKKSGDTGGKADTATKDDGGKKGGKTAYDAASSKGTVSGTVKLAGDPPEAKKLAISGDDFCKGAWDSGHIDQRFEVGEGGGLPHVFVFAIKGPHKELKFKPEHSPTTGLAVSQKGCIYAPHVFGVMVGQEFTVSNDDETSHNVHVKPKRNDVSNISQAAGKTDKITFKKKEKAIAIVCDIHSWMSAWAHCQDHPFFATTDAKGAFSIAGLPDGDYEFGAWHENFGEAKFKVTVKDGKADPVDVSLGE